MKTKKIITIAITVIAGLMVILSRTMKLLNSKVLITTLVNVGVDNYITELGLMEILFAALFLFPKTMKIGFIIELLLFRSNGNRAFAQWQRYRCGDSACFGLGGCFFA